MKILRLNKEREPDANNLGLVRTAQ